MRLYRLSISIGISLTATLASFAIAEAAPGYGTMALSTLMSGPGILIARLFIPPAPPRIPGTGFIVGAISFVFYSVILYLIFWLYDMKRPT
jgi:hypothetical protein